MRVRSFRTTLPLTFLSLTWSPLWSQSPDTVLLSPVVVTATRYPAATSAIASSVTVISGDALRARGITSVADALRLVPGAAIVATGSYGGQTSLFLRGGESDYVKVLVDGVPQNQPGGFYDFANLGTEDVERIEIVRGPVSVLYGSDAVTGVVQVFTRSGAGRPVGQLSLGVGRYGSEWGEGSVSGGGHRVQYAVSAARQSTDGIYAFNNHDRRELVGVRLLAQPDPRTQASLSARYTEGVFHFPTDYIGVPSDSDQRTSSRGPSLGLELWRWLSGRVEAHVSAVYHWEESRYDDGQDSPGDTSTFCCSHSRDILRRLVLGARADVHLAEATVVSAGLELERQRQEGSTLDTARHNAALYVQTLIPAGRSISLTLGGRVEDNQHFGQHLTGRAGMVWRPDEVTRLRVSAGSGFKEPSFYENFASGFVRGNPDLRPERSASWELGVERSAWRGRFTVGATYFDQRFRDLIQYSPVPVGVDSVNYVNVGDATARGLELAATTRVGRFLTFETTYGSLRTRDRSTGQRLQRRPSHTVALQAELDLAGRGSVTLAARFTGDRGDLDFSAFPAATVSLPAYTMVDLSAVYRITRPRGGLPGVALSGRIANLLDRQYQEVLNFPAPGRALFVAARLDFAP